MKWSTLFSLAMLAVVGGCQPFSELNGTTVSMSGAGIVMNQPLEPYGPRALANLIYHSTPAWTANESRENNNISPLKEAAAAQFPTNPLNPDPRDPVLDQAIGWFNRHVHGDPSQVSSVAPSDRQTRMRDARNQIQGMIFVASTNQCNKYKLMLRERSTNISFLLGSVATGLGAAGAIFTNATSQILAGAAAGTSGINAEYNRNIMSNLTSAVIIPGIEKQRAAIAQEVANRRCLGVGSYSLSQALADAVRFHAACSTDVGVAAAGSALSQSHQVTLADAKATVDAINALQAALQKGKSSPAPTTGGGGATSSGSAPQKQNPEDDNGASSRTALLLGDPINFLQCPKLDGDGLLPNNASPAAGSNPNSSAQIPFGITKVP